MSEFFEYDRNNEALRLIKQMENECPENWDDAAIRAELRRLHEAHDWQYRMAADRLRRIEKLEAERDAVVAQRQWQPIRTAPKDGRAILVWNDTSKNCEVVFWNGHWAYQGEDHFGVCCSKWMSLDAAIDAAKGKARCTAKK